MLTRRAALLAGALLTIAAAGVRGQDDEPDAGLRLPAQLTVGVADQFLGQLAPDGKTLVFVSNRDAITEIFSQPVDGGRARLLFDEGADVTWPRVSPDGRSLLYISYRDRAAGQLCVRDLPDAGGRRCYDDGSSALQAEWIDRQRIVLVGRASIEGDLGVQEVTTGGRLSARPLLERNLTSPALSPDGRWLVYVPVERAARLVGPAFAARAGQRLEAVRLDRPGPPTPLPIDLPGLTGQPAFARDGRHLYFVQFFSDSNRDGVIDARDHGVLFRVPFPGERDDAPARAAAAAPEQLTDASWNCQYPAPAADRLVATCSRDRDVDVYQLPLDGEVPEEWSAERLDQEIDLASKRSEELLLYRHRLARERALTGRRLLTVRLVRLHLGLGEYRPAEFYARSLASLPDPVTAGLSQPLLALVEHRRAVRDREHGRMSEAFGEAARRRMELLRPEAADSPPAVVLDHVVRSEIAGDLGDGAAARRELEAAAVGDATPRSVLELYYERADALYRELDDRAALAATCRRLAASKAFEPDDQLEYARAAVRAMVRGLPFAEADARLARERAAAAGEPELAFALDLGRAVLALRAAPVPAEVREALLTLYRAQTRPDRRRAVVLDAVQRAADLGADRVIEALAQLYVESAQPGTQERRRAERLYRRAIAGRAFRHLGQGRLAEARADFDAVARRTASLESVVSSLDLRLGAGEAPAALAAEYAGSGDGAASPQARFVEAYLLARHLPRLEGDAHAGAVADALAALRSAWADLGSQRVARELQGALLHEQHLRTGDLEAAERASGHYLVALDLARTNVRLRALLLGQLGLLHAGVGNYQIALGYLLERERLPFRADEASLAVRLAEARALLHVGRGGEAASAADRALAMVEGAPPLGAFHVLALDRAALYNLEAGRFQRALALYDAELPLLGEAHDPGAGRNLLVARLARAAAALGAGHPLRTLEDLAEVERGLGDPALAPALRWPFTKPAEVQRAYRLIASGLRANASRRLGQLEEAARALEERRALALGRLADRDLDENVRALTLVEARLAENAAARHDLGAAGAWLGHALEHADALVDRTHAAVDPDRLDVLLFAAELRALAHAPIPFDLPARLDGADERLARQPDPAFRTYQRWFEIYLTLATTPSP